MNKTNIRALSLSADAMPASFYPQLANKSGTRWRHIALYLGLSNNMVDQIRSEFPPQVAGNELQCANRMFLRWRQTTLEPTVRDLCEGLDQAGEGALQNFVLDAALKQVSEGEDVPKKSWDCTDGVHVGKTIRAQLNGTHAGKTSIPGQDALQQSADSMPESFYLNLAKLMSTRWDGIGVYLGVGIDRIEQIQGTYPPMVPGNCLQCGVAMLQEWKRQKPRTLEELCRGLKAAREGQAEKFVIMEASKAWEGKQRTPAPQKNVPTQERTDRPMMDVFQNEARTPPVILHQQKPTDLRHHQKVTDFPPQGRKLTDLDMYNVADHLNNKHDIRRLGLTLGLATYTIETQFQDHARDIRSAAYGTVRQWRRRQGTDQEAWESLGRGLVEAKLERVAWEVLGYPGQPPAEVQPAEPAPPRHEQPEARGSRDHVGEDYVDGHTPGELSPPNSAKVLQGIETLRLSVDDIQDAFFNDVLAPQMCTAPAHNTARPLTVAQDNQSGVAHAQSIGRHLGVSEDDLDRLGQESCSGLEFARGVLKTWMTVDGWETKKTVLDLFSGLVKARQDSLAALVQTEASAYRISNQNQ